MNNWKINKTVDLARGIDGVDVWPHALLVENDGNAHEINITVMDDGLPVELTGTATAYFVRVDDATVIEPATVNGNVVSVTLPEACYAYEGDLKAVIRITDGESTVTLGAFLFFVRPMTTNFVVDPSEIVPSLEELLQQIQQMENVSKAANDAAESANTAADSANKAAEAAQAVMDDIEAALDEAGQALSEAKQTKELSESALNDANQALENANTATSAANDATNLANEAASGANAAADAANQAATDAESRVSAAVQSAETSVDEAIKNAQQQVDESLSAAQQTLDSAVADANSAVENAVSDANAATQAANTAASGADTAAAGANAQANAAEQAAQTASNAAGSAQTATEAAEDATRKALDAAERANKAASGVGIRKKIVDVLPAKADMEQDVLYLVRRAEPNADNIYDEYMLINGEVEAIGSTKTDFEDYAKKDELADVATSGSYNDLIEKPELAKVATSGSYEDLTEKPELANVATSGNYADLTGTENVATKGYVTEQIDAVEIGGTNLFAVSKAVRKLVLNSGGIIDSAAYLTIEKLELPSYVKKVAFQMWGDTKQLDEFGEGLYSFAAFFNADNGFIRKFFIATREVGTGQYDGKILDVPTDAKYVYFGCRIEQSLVNNVRMKFEFGDKPTDWSPAPEDVDHAISRRAVVTYDYGGKNLKEAFGTAEALHNALAAEDYSQIAVGDYWPITLNGTFWDYGSYTVKSGVKYYSNNTLQAEAGTTAATYEGAYASNTAVSFVLSGSTYYVNTSDCLPYFARTCNNVAVKLEVAGINHYWRYGDAGELAGNKPHIVFISRDCLPFSMRTRKSNDVWEDTQINNPWLGSALFKTFNDNEHGILKLLESTDVGKFIYAGPNNKGMRARIEEKGPNDISATKFIWLDRGKLFIPNISEVAGQPLFLNVSGNTNPWATPWASSPTSQFEIFIGSFRHVAKGFGDGGSRTMIRLASTSQVDKVSFSHVDVNGNFGVSHAENILNSTVLCFVFV